MMSAHMGMPCLFFYPSSIVFYFVIMLHYLSLFYNRYLHLKEVLVAKTGVPGLGTDIQREYTLIFCPSHTFYLPESTWVYGHAEHQCNRKLGHAQDSNGIKWCLTLTLSVI